MRKGLVAAVVIALVVLPAVTFAETMYITDRVEASIRSGKGLAAGSQYLGVVHTGDKVEVLLTEGEYARVVSPGGIEGWLHTRYLSSQPPADSQTLKEKLKTAQDEAAKIKEEKAELEAQRDQHLAKIKEAEAAYAKLKADCADILKVRAEVDKAQHELQTGTGVIAQLKRENEELAQNAQLLWFVSGAGAVLCGFIIGMWLQSLRKKHKPKFNF